MKSATPMIGRRIGHLLRELGVRASSVWAGQGISVMIFPGGGPGGTASGLRGWSLAPPLRELGFRVIVVPPQLELKQRIRLVAAERPEFLIFQKCRDPLNDPALYPHTPCILDMDDADFLHPAATDRIARITSECLAAVGGSVFVADWLGQYCPTTRVIWTGSPLADVVNGTKPSRTSRTLVYAVSDILGYPEESAFVRNIILALGPGAGLGLHLIGRGDRDAVLDFFAPVVRAGIRVELTGWLPYKKLIQKIGEGAVGLAPLASETSVYSQGKSFGKVLAYLAAGIPVLCSDAAEYPHFFRSGINGYVLPNDPSVWSNTILGLLADPVQQENLVAAANQDFHDRLSATAMAARWAILLTELKESQNWGARSR